MKKQIVTILMTSALALGITACGAGTAEDQASGENQTDTGAATGSSDILIAYFSVPKDVDTEGIDADAGASIVVDDGQVKGNGKCRRLRCGADKPGSAGTGSDAGYRSHVGCVWRIQSGGKVDKIDRKEDALWNM